MRQNVLGQALEPQAKPQHEPGSAATAVQGVGRAWEVAQGVGNSPSLDLSPGAWGGGRHGRSGWTVVGAGCQDPACLPRGAGPI